MAHALHFGGSGDGKEATRRTRVEALHFGGNGEEAKRTRVKALNFDGSDKDEESIRRTSMKTQHYGDCDGDGEEAAIQTREMMTGIGRGTPIRRKSTPLVDSQGKVSRPMFDFVDDVVPKAHDFSEVRTEDK